MLDEEGHSNWATVRIQPILENPIVHRCHVVSDGVVKGE